MGWGRALGLRQEGCRGNQKFPTKLGACVAWDWGEEDTAGGGSLPPPPPPKPFPLGKERSKGGILLKGVGIAGLRQNMMEGQ